MIQTCSEALVDRETRGALQATRRAIVLLARNRHAELPDGFEERLEAIENLSRLYAILEQVPDVASLEELDLKP